MATKEGCKGVSVPMFAVRRQKVLRVAVEALGYKLTMPGTPLRHVVMQKAYLYVHLIASCHLKLFSCAPGKDNVFCDSER